MASVTERTRVDAVIFDLDGVLTDTAEFHFRAWQELAAAEGLPFDRTANEALRGLSREASLERMLDGRRIDEATRRAWLDRKNRTYLAQLDRMTAEDLLPGAPELLDDAERLGLAMAVGSSSRNARRVLDRLGITGRFDAIVDGNDVQRSKPDPQVFVMAALRLGVEPARCLVVEDAASGVAAALAAGCTVIGVGPPERVGEAHHVVPSTAALDLCALVDAG